MQDTAQEEVAQKVATPDGMMTEEIGKLALALANAQAEIEGAKKDATNPFYKTNYADLSSVWDACHKALNKNELAVVQMVDGKELVTILAHSSGQWVKSRMALYPKDWTVQSIGSAITYARRYALAAMVGVCPVDDDGEEAVGRKSETNPAGKVAVTGAPLAKVTSKKSGWEGDIESAKTLEQLEFVAGMIKDDKTVSPPLRDILHKAYQAKHTELKKKV